MLFKILYTNFIGALSSSYSLRKKLWYYFAMKYNAIKTRETEMNDEDGAQFRFFHKIHAACNSVAMGVSTEHSMVF